MRDRKEGVNKGVSERELWYLEMAIPREILWSSYRYVGLTFDHIENLRIIISFEQRCTRHFQRLFSDLILFEIIACSIIFVNLICTYIY